ncbi:uncharacterized protein LOC124789266 [Schistocerca piceifrons]|uniref:uncharacterized protein LOC124789266 n=1 Tax=Schistocerca piceifrons TaxID=274613 RepID=UPI001F5E5AEF|nr:uncharacterized protein LOC124789266 [Schistocerca piceifrons]
MESETFSNKILLFQENRKTRVLWVKEVHWDIEKCGITAEKIVNKQIFRKKVVEVKDFFEEKTRKNRAFSAERRARLQCGHRLPHTRRLAQKAAVRHTPQVSRRAAGERLTAQVNRQCLLNGHSASIAVYGPPQQVPDRCTSTGCCSSATKAGICPPVPQLDAINPPMNQLLWTLKYFVSRNFLLSLETSLVLARGQPAGLLTLDNMHKRQFY